MPTKLDNNILAAAIEGFEAQKKRLDAQIAEIRQLLTGVRSEPAAKPEPQRKRRMMSAASRKRIAEAQRKRWAAAKKQSGAAPKAAKPEARKPKRKLSAAGRKRIIEATRRRWALVRAAAAKSAT
jgi:peptidoglycan hydrolase CwlO-like protein